MARTPGLSQKAADSQGLPAGFKTYSPYPFGGMNTQAAPHAIADTDFTWVENFVRLGDGNLRTLWDKGDPIYTAPGGRTIVYYMFYTLATSYYAAVFLDDGSAVQVSLPSSSTTVIGASGFYDPMTGYLPYAKQWGSTYLLICNRNTVNDYWAWDGTLLYGAGTSAPDGVVLLSGGFDYNAPPMIAAYGGSGSGMTFDSKVDTGSVVQVTITNPGSGYRPSDVVQLQFAGGGSDSSAILESVLTAGTVGGTSVTAPGSGYLTVPTVAFSGGGGSGATGVAVLTGTTVTSITLTNPGTGYTSAPSVTISGGSGTGATAIAVLNPQGVASVFVADGGTGFTSVPLITFVGGGGSGATGLVILNPTSIAYANLTSGGSGYTSAPTVTINTDPAFGGTPATITAHIVGDRVGFLTVDDPGSGYTTPAELVFTDGDGAGAGGTVVFAPTSIASVVVSNIGKFYTDVPAVEVTPGANNSAYATVTLMPFGVSGSAMETFLSRVWIIDPAIQPNSTTPPGNIFQFSAAESIVDFATSDGGGQQTNTDSFLQTKYVNIRQSAGYLYLFGDGSGSVISNVTTSGQPVTTTFNYQNVDPQSGLFWRDSIQDFGRSIILGNETGLFGLYGGAITNISVNIQQTFNKLIMPENGGVVPSSATATIFNVKHSVNLMTLTDPDSGVNRNVMLLWNEKNWTVASQSVDMKIIASRKVGSTYSCYGSDGVSIYPFFATPSVSLTKRIDTKVYGADRMFMQKDVLAAWMVGQSHTADPVTAAWGLVLSGISPLVAAGHPTPYDSPQQNRVAANITVQPSFSSPEPYWGLFGTGIGSEACTMAQMRMMSNAADFTLGNLLIGYTERLAYYGQ